MSTVIRSCPGCKSLILSDTDQCPECGHVFYQRRDSLVSATMDVDTLKTASVHEACPHCGELVRSGLVRCWSCNGFMRADIAARYKDLTSNPQRIIYSTIPLADRTDFLPARSDLADGSRPVVYDADGFSFDEEPDNGELPEFDLDGPLVAPSPSNKTVESAKSKSALPDGPDKPQSTTPGGVRPSPAKSESTAASGATEAAANADTAASGRPSKAGETVASDDDLFSIAMQEEREVKKRRVTKIAERQKKQMLVPCSCGAWIRVLEDQGGKTVRCRQCKQAVQIPEIRRRSEKKDDKPAVARMNIAWISDVWFHSISPTSLVLKPGSLADKHTEADLAFTDSGLHVVTFGSADKKKKTGLSFGAAKKPDIAAQRQQFRDQVVAAGELKSAAGAEVRSISGDRIREIRLVQPILKAQESMFAGVPVFGEGRIAVFLPIDAEEGQQLFCSFALNAWRIMAERLKVLFNFELPAAENGVPESEKSETLSCFVNQSKVEAVKNLTYYQKDSAFELELTGYRCKACSVAISEEGRKKNKLGGTNGAGIAKAKCPKCSQKMGEERLYKIKKSPGSPQTPAG